MITFTVTVFETLLFEYRSIKLQAGNLIDKKTNHIPNFSIIQNMGEEP